MPGPAAAWQPDARGARDQPGDGRLQARIRAGRARRIAGADAARLQPERRAGDDAHGGAAPRRERPGRARDRHECRRQRLRLGQPRQCHDRPRDPPRAAQCRRRLAGRSRQGDPGPSRQIHLRRRRERGREPVGALPCREGLRARRLDRLRHRRRAAAQRHQPRRRRPRGHPRQHLLGDEHDRQQQRGVVRPLRGRDRPRARAARSPARAGPGTTCATTCT